MPQTQNLRPACDDIARLRRITKSLTLWLEKALKQALSELQPAQADRVLGPKNSLLAMLVTLVDIAVALEKAAPRAEGISAGMVLPPLSNADIALMKDYISKLPE